MRLQTILFLICCETIFNVNEAQASTKSIFQYYLLPLGETNTASFSPENLWKIKPKAQFWARSHLYTKVDIMLEYGP